MGLAILRVTVRGEFRDLTDEQRAELAAAVDEHDIMRSAYTRDGTFTYDERIVAFSYRFEVRVQTDDLGSSDDASSTAVAEGLRQAEADLDTRGLAHKRLRASAVDMADMWK